MVAFVEWNESPIATTITTRPISELVFPSVTVCPPRGSNTALNLALENVNDENFTKEQREHLLDFSTKIFLLEPNQRRASHLVDLVNPSNLRGLYKGEISLPEVTEKYTFAIKSRQSKGSFVTPEYGVGDTGVVVAHPNKGSPNLKKLYVSMILVESSINGHPTNLWRRGILLQYSI